MAIFGKKIEETTAKKPAAAKPAKEAVKSMQDLYGADAPKAAAKGGAKSAKVKTVAGSQSYRILVKPLITEKSADLNSLHKFAFAVAADANKISVARAIAELYGVKPVKVNIINNLGKVKTRGRITGKRKDWKKAIVTLPAGTKLDVYEGV